MTTRLEARNLGVRFGDTPALQGVDFVVPPHRFTVVIGPNACGKSTLVRSLARAQKPSSGDVLLDDVPIRQRPTKQVAQVVGYLPQGPTAPEGITVRDLVGRGRFPYQTILRQWSREDDTAVDRALARTGMTAFADRDVAALSGGQRQRAWIALTLAQETDILLLDEPTTFLDLSHQIDVLDVSRALVAEGITIVAVLHELNLACRYADHLVVMSHGRIVAEGAPTEVVTAELVGEVFSLPARIEPDPETGLPMVIPLDRASR